ncbi:hypothetical protein GCM10018771_63960 [Streptomyces cellulosae]|nr:hypothetical protein GCM10018771_63960 [Streptomyces cellulosae]
MRLTRGGAGRLPHGLTYGCPDAGPHRPPLPCPWPSSAARHGPALIRPYATEGGAPPGESRPGLRARPRHRPDARADNRPGASRTHSAFSAAAVARDKPSRYPFGSFGLRITTERQ